MSERFTETLHRWVPAIGSLRGYNASMFRRDFFAGVTVAAVAVPQAIAYAKIFGMPAEMGLYTAIVMTSVGAMLDSSKQLINGPTNAISIAMLSALAAILVLTAFRMTELATLKYIAKATRFDALILAITALSAILVSVEFCILIGVALWTDRDAQRCRC
jgi:MFS superfamily sulfate permease-like transporter